MPRSELIMRKIAICILLASALTFMSGCSRQPEIKQLSTGEEVVLTDERETDNRMSDWNLTNSDAELYIGDLGVEQLYESNQNQIRSMAAGSTKQRLLPNGFPLIK